MPNGNEKCAMKTWELFDRHKYHYLRNFEVANARWEKKMDDIVYMNLINSSLWSLARSCLVNEAINGRFNQLELRDNNYCFVGAFSSAANGWIIGDGVDEVHSISFYVRCTALPDQTQLNGMQEYTRRKHIINKIWYKIASNNSP